MSRNSNSSTLNNSLLPNINDTEASLRQKNLPQSNDINSYSSGSVASAPIFHNVHDMASISNCNDYYFIDYIDFFLILI